jgi:hypothetical protein
MAPKSLEQLFDDAKEKHLAETTLVSYRDDQLDRIGLALADAHLRLCLICQRRLSFLREELLEGQVMTELLPARKATDIHTEWLRLSAYIRDLLDAWLVVFSKQTMRGTGDGDEVWKYKSKDGLLTAWAILENDASLTVHFSSPELAWEGTRIRFRLGPFSKEVTLQREGDSRVVAKVEILRRERAKKMADISIEVISAP